MFDDFEYHCPQPDCGLAEPKFDFLETENGLEMLIEDSTIQQTNDYVTQNIYLQNKVQELEKQLGESHVPYQKLREDYMNYMAKFLPLEEEKQKLKLKCDTLEKKIEHLNNSKYAVAMHNKQLSALVENQVKEIQITKKQINELEENLQISREIAKRNVSERNKTAVICRSALASVVKAAIVLKRKKLLPTDCSRRIHYWKKLHTKLTDDSANSLERLDNSDLSDDSDIEAMDYLLQKQLAEQDYSSARQNKGDINANPNLNILKSCEEKGINTDVSDDILKLNVGVQTDLEYSETHNEKIKIYLEKGINTDEPDCTVLKESDCSVKQKSLFSPEPDQTAIFSCGSTNQFESSDWTSECTDSLDDSLYFKSSAELLTISHLTPLISNDCSGYKSSVIKTSKEIRTNTKVSNSNVDVKPILEGRSCRVKPKSIFSPETVKQFESCDLSESSSDDDVIYLKTSPKLTRNQKTTKAPTNRRLSNVYKQSESIDCLTECNDSLSSNDDVISLKSSPELIREYKIAKSVLNHPSSVGCNDAISNIKTNLEIRTNTVVSDSLVELNVGVKTVLEEHECSVNPISKFSKPVAFPCDSDNKSPSFGRLGTVDCQMNVCLEKPTLSNLSHEAATSVINQIKEAQESKTNNVFTLLLHNLMDINSTKEIPEGNNHFKPLPLSNTFKTRRHRESGSPKHLMDVSIHSNKEMPEQSVVNSNKHYKTSRLSNTFKRNQKKVSD